MFSIFLFFFSFFFFCCCCGAELLIHTLALVSQFGSTLISWFEDYNHSLFTSNFFFFFFFFFSEPHFPPLFLYFYTFFLFSFIHCKFSAFLFSHHSLSSLLPLLFCLIVSLHLYQISNSLFALCLSFLFFHPYLGNHYQLYHHYLCCVPSLKSQTHSSQFFFNQYKKKRFLKWDRKTKKVPQKKDWKNSFLLIFFRFNQLALSLL